MPIQITPQAKSVQSLYNLYRNDELVVDRSYQRKLVWTLQEKVALIDSILRKYPIPLVLFAETQDNSSAFYILDGMQRLNAIFDFIENRFSLDDQKFFDVNEFPTAKDAAAKGHFEVTKSKKKLTRAQVASILDYTIPVSVIRGASDEEIKNVFSRINSYGRQLSDQERRQAGVKSAFSECVRVLASKIRGDASPNTLPLARMPSISVDSITSGLGYGVQAGDLFWVKQKILRSTELRNGEDEQVIADTIAAMILKGPLPRSKEALDNLYDVGSSQQVKVDTAIKSYGIEKIIDEYTYLVSLIEKIVSVSGKSHLRELVFKNQTTNPYSTVFGAILLALHELVVVQDKSLSDFSKVVSGLSGVGEKIKVGMSGQDANERKKNIATVVGNVQAGFSNKSVKHEIYNNPNAVNVRNVLTASRMENAIIEVKQGITNLEGAEKGKINLALLERIPSLISGLANVTSFEESYLLLGVSDSEITANKIKQNPAKIGDFWITGIEHEFDKIAPKAGAPKREAYINKVRDVISKSKLSAAVKSQVLETISILDFDGVELLCIRIESSKDVCFVDEDVFVRQSNETVKASVRQVSELTKAKNKFRKKAAR